MSRFPWGGIVKLQEEMSELGVELAKLHAAPDGKHWDNKHKDEPLIQRVENELGDVYAALDFFIESNFSRAGAQAIQNRRQRKLDRFRQWEAEEGMTGTKAVVERVRLLAACSCVQCEGTGFDYKEKPPHDCQACNGTGRQ